MDRWHLDTLVVRFEIDRNPLPKERPRTIRRGTRSITFTPKRTRDYEAYVALLARQAMGDREPEKGLVALRIVFYRARRAADLTNLCKSPEDSMQGIVFKNDNQVVDLCAQWFRDKENPRALVSVWTVKGDE